MEIALGHLLKTGKITASTTAAELLALIETRQDVKPVPAPRRKNVGPPTWERPIPVPRQKVKVVIPEPTQQADKTVPTPRRPKPVPRRQKLVALQPPIPNIIDEPIPKEIQRRLSKPLTPIPTSAGRRRQVAPSEFQRTPYAIQNYLRDWVVRPPGDEADPAAFLDRNKEKIRRKLVEEIVDLKGVKFSIALRVSLKKEKNDGNDVHADPVFWSKQEAVLKAADIGDPLDTAIARVLQGIESYMRDGSGWIIENVVELFLNIARYQPLRGGSYIDLPASIKKKHAVVNVKNNDDHCLRWSLLAAKYPTDQNPHRPGKYVAHWDTLDFAGIESPTPLSKIPQIERQNGLAINVFGHDKSVYPLHISDAAAYIPRTNLLLIERGGKQHYTWIKDLNRLLFKQSLHKERKHFCERCLHCFCREDLLEKHKPECQGVNGRPMRTRMPTDEEKMLRFVNYQKQLKVPFVIYADFEALTTKIEGPDVDPTKSSTQKTQLHEISGFSYVVTRCDGIHEQPVVYRGPVAAQRFLECLGAEELKIKGVLANPAPMVITTAEQISFDEAHDCHVCSKPLEEDRVRDHCHITGGYRGPAHNECNLKLHLSAKTTPIPVVFHNLRGYDSHLIMQAISQTDGNISCIPNNMEKYISFSLRSLRFIDSAQFLLAPLDRLVAATDRAAFRLTNAVEPDPQKVALLLKKGEYPYEYMDGWEKFQETQLPPRETFYNKLSDEEISDEDYDHAQKVWDIFGCRTMGDYHDLYLRTDTVLLADVFENFRQTCLTQYGLDPAHYYTSPGLSWDALLKKTGVELELLTDYDMFLFVERGLRGGVSMVSRRHCKANNPRVEGYNPAKPNTHIMYLDANNLYGWAMSQYLPTGGFEWVEKPDEVHIQDHPDDAPKGYILEVDLEYPEELHDAHNEYPLAPERLQVQDAWMSEYQQTLRGRIGGSPETEKLVPNLRNKQKYVVHYRNLKQYLSLGMCLTKIHRALTFDQSPWMEPYIRLNTELRKQATSDFEKDLFKLMNNSVFGKTMENMRKRQDVKLVRATEEDKLRRYLAKPNFARAKIFDDNLAALHMYKTSLYLNRPTYVGMSILDLSKLLMYDFYYNHIKQEYGPPLHGHR